MRAPKPLSVGVFIVPIEDAPPEEELTPPEGFAFVVDGNDDYVVDGDGAYVVAEI